jgi:hypothetical protein
MKILFLGEIGARRLACACGAFERLGHEVRGVHTDRTVDESAVAETTATGLDSG